MASKFSSQIYKAGALGGNVFFRVSPILGECFMWSPVVDTAVAGINSLESYKLNIPSSSGPLHAMHKLLQETLLLLTLVLLVCQSPFLLMVSYFLTS